MADSGFSSKTTLALRIFFICSLFLVAPLLFYALFLLIQEEQYTVARVTFELAILLCSILLVGGIGAYLLTKRLAKPLKKLFRVMEKVGEGHLEARFQSDPWGFEVNSIGENFNSMVASLSRHIEEVKKERVARALLTNELKIGHEIQKSLFPKEMPELPGLEIAVGFLAAHEVAGDFYDLYVNKNNQLTIAVADAAGKGIGACLYALTVRSMLRSFSNAPDFPDMIRSTNNLFCQDTGDSGFFVTAWIGRYDPASHLLSYSSQGHLPALLKTAGSIQELSTAGISLGVTPFDKMISSERQLRKGDTLILYTDGVIEAHDKHNALFGKERFLALLKKEGTAKQLVDNVLKEMESFAKGAKQHDDITLLVIRIL